MLVAMPSAAFACTISEVVAGACGSGSGGTVSESRVDLWAVNTQGDHSPKPGESDGGNTNAPIDYPNGATKREPIEWTEVCQDGHLECVDVPAPAAPPATPAPGVAPTVVTLRDIAAFRPATPGNDMEPGGWAVVGLPANFVAAASAQVVPGTLLGQPADVRFTPIGYRWRHSDGATVASRSRGASWAQLGQKEFTATGTSHAYAASGEYAVTLEVALAAEYRFAGSAWIPIAGTLSVASDPRTVLVGEIDTVLTRGDCVAAPGDPGC
ncbi:hypothetical protein [Agromyces sp. PvR057]|uniref:hypothetical protein n=1 Tax=Agromyces sp. PvR057 TaxID=3156403 RepID=UPI003391030F